METILVDQNKTIYYFLFNYRLSSSDEQSAEQHQYVKLNQHQPITPH